MTGLDNRVPPPLVMLILAAAMGCYGWLAPGSALILPLPARAGAALALIVAAGFFAPRAFRAFQRAKTTASPRRIDEVSALVTTGIFAHTRNPMYVSLALFLLALAVLIGRVELLLGPLAFVLYVTRFQILPEERMLRARFGDAYADYLTRVPRWLVF